MTVSVTLLIMLAKRMHHTIFSSMACLALSYFSTLPYEWHDFRKKEVIGSKMHFDFL